ncbi:MAG: hypothetical protein ABGX16_21055 [Pirellulales bacterium]
MPYVTNDVHTERGQRAMECSDLFAEGKGQGAIIMPARAVG